MRKNWTLAEENFLKENWANMSLSELTEAFNEKFNAKRTELAIDSKIDRMKLPRKRKHYRKNYANEESKLEFEGRGKMIEFLRIKAQIKECNNVKIKVKTDGPTVKDRIVDGTIIEKNDNFIAVKLKEYIECYRYTDFYTGRAVII